MQPFLNHSCSGGARIYSLGAKLEHQRREDRGAACAETETLRALRRGAMGYRSIPLPSRLGGPGSVVSSPSGVRTKPRPKTILLLSRSDRTPLIVIFVVI